MEQDIIILWRHIEKRDGGSLAPPATASPSVVRALKGSAVIAGFFLLGTACGWLRLLPVSIAGTELSFYALCALMVCVGIGIGQDTQTLKRFRSLNPRLALLPLLTVAGTLAGTAAVSQKRRPRQMFTLDATSGVAVPSFERILPLLHASAEPFELLRVVYGLGARRGSVLQDGSRFRTLLLGAEP